MISLKSLERTTFAQELGLALLNLNGRPVVFKTASPRLRPFSDSEWRFGMVGVEWSPGFSSPLSDVRILGVA